MLNPLRLILTENHDEIEALFAAARAAREKHYGKSVYFRGLIEISNYCKNDCYYCGIRHSNKKLERYRLSTAEILDCCRAGDKLGYKTFVLQGGEDPLLTDAVAAEIVSSIRREFPSHAITLSLGERSRRSYELLYRAGANRYLLRHETASVEHYGRLHPPSMSYVNRMRCLLQLKEIGYQVGAGFMVGTPFQMPEYLLEDLRFIESLRPQMVGIGPFIPQKDTPFGGKPGGGLLSSLKMIALTRLLLPQALIPATTALETIAPNGRERALMAGANVVMPNLTPLSSRKLYAIYDNKAGTGDDTDSIHSAVIKKITAAGFFPDMGRGDPKPE